MYQDYALPDTHEDYPYQNTSSSEDEGIDSETEAELYAQVHYAEDLSTLNYVDVVEEGGNEGDKGHDRRDNKVEPGYGEQNQGGTEGWLHTGGSGEGDGDGDRVASHVLPVVPKHHAHTSHLPTRTEGAGSREHRGVGRTERSGRAKRSRAERLKTVGKSVVATANSDSEHDSDGSGVSNYQILDGRTITGDELLQLNVVGKKAGASPGGPILDTEKNTDADGDAERWEVDERDLEVQSGKFQRSRYYRDISHSGVRCRNCDRVGHLSKVCPEPPRKSACFLCGGRDHQSSTCPSAVCHFCSNPGHQTRYCKGRYRCAENVCLHCHWKGHLARDCPDKWRQYHSTTAVGAAIVRGSGDRNNNVWCYNCGAQGHFGHDCSWPPMCKYLYPSSPFITVYGESTHHGKGKKRKYDADNDSYRSHNKRARRDGQAYQSPHGTKQNFKDTKKKSKLPQFVQTAFSKVKNKITGKKKGPSEKKKKWLERKNVAMSSQEAYENQLMAYDLKQLDQRCKSNFKRNANKKKKKVKQKIQQGGGWTDPREWRGVQVQVGKGGRQVSLQQTQGRKDAAAKSRAQKKNDRRKANRSRMREQAQQAQQGWGQGATGHSKHAKNKFVSAQGFATSFRGFNHGKKQW